MTERTGSNYRTLVLQDSGFSDYGPDLQWSIADTQESGYTYADNLRYAKNESLRELSRGNLKAEFEIVQIVTKVKAIPVSYEIKELDANGKEIEKSET